MLIESTNQERTQIEWKTRIGWYQTEERWALSQTWRKRGLWGDEEPHGDPGSSRREGRKAKGNTPPIWRTGRMPITIRGGLTGGEMSWVSDGRQGAASSGGGLGCGLLSDEPTPKLYREDPGSLWQPVQSLPSFFWPFGKTAGQSSVWLETKSHRLFLLSHFRITLHKSFYWKYRPVLCLTKCLLVSLPRSLILGKYFSFMITWCLDGSAWIGITKIVCLQLYYICFRNARKT